MKQTDCHQCKYGDISDKPRTLTLGNTVIHQNGGVICRCPKAGTISFDGDSFRCSSFAERSGGDGNVD